PGGKLIAGERRLAAVKILGWETVPVHVVDLVDVRRGEWVENACRKGFTWGERVSILRALAPDVAIPPGRPPKNGNGEATRCAGTPSPETTASCGSFPGGRHAETRSKSRAQTTSAKVAAYCGVGTRTLEKAAAVVDAGSQDPGKYGRLVEDMERTGRVNGV